MPATSLRKERLNNRPANKLTPNYTRREGAIPVTSTQLESGNLLDIPIPGNRTPILHETIASHEFWRFVRASYSTGNGSRTVPGLVISFDSAVPAGFSEEFQVVFSKEPPPANLSLADIQGLVTNTVSRRWNVSRNNRWELSAQELHLVTTQFTEDAWMSQDDSPIVHLVIIPLTALTSAFKEHMLAGSGIVGNIMIEWSIETRLWKQMTDESALSIDWESVAANYSNLEWVARQFTIPLADTATGSASSVLSVPFLMKADEWLSGLDDSLWPRSWPARSSVSEDTIFLMAYDTVVDNESAYMRTLANTAALQRALEARGSDIGAAPQLDTQGLLTVAHDYATTSTVSYTSNGASATGLSTVTADQSQGSWIMQTIEEAASVASQIWNTVSTFIEVSAFLLSKTTTEPSNQSKWFGAMNLLLNAIGDVDHPFILADQTSEDSANWWVSQVLKTRRSLQEQSLDSCIVPRFIARRTNGVYTTMAAWQAANSDWINTAMQYVYQGQISTTVYTADVGGGNLVMELQDPSNVGAYFPGSKPPSYKRRIKTRQVVRQTTKPQSCLPLTAGHVGCANVLVVMNSVAGTAEFRFDFVEGFPGFNVYAADGDYTSELLSNFPSPSVDGWPTGETFDAFVAGNMYELDFRWAYSSNTDNASPAEAAASGSYNVIADPLRHKLICVRGGTGYYLRALSDATFNAGNTYCTFNSLKPSSAAETYIYGIGWLKPFNIVKTKVLQKSLNVRLPGYDRAAASSSSVSSAVRSAPRPSKPLPQSRHPTSFVQQQKRPQPAVKQAPRPAPPSKPKVGKGKKKQSQINNKKAEKKKKTHARKERSKAKPPHAGGRRK